MGQVHQASDRLVYHPDRQQQQGLSVHECREGLVAPVPVSASLIGRAAAPADRNERHDQGCRIRKHMGGFGKERDRVREVPAHGLDDREAAENQQCNEQPAPAGIVRMAMRAPPMAVAVPMAMAVSMLMLVLMLMSGMRAVLRVKMVVVMLVRVRHEPGTP